MHHIKKGFDCKKNRICFETALTKKVASIKTGFTCIKKVFPAQRKQKKRKAFLPTGFWSQKNRISSHPENLDLMILVQPQILSDISIIGP